MLVGSSAHTGIGLSTPRSVNSAVTRGAMIRVEVVMLGERHFIIILSLESGAAFSCET